MGPLLTTAWIAAGLQEDFYSRGKGGKMGPLRIAARIAARLQEDFSGRLKSS